MEFIAGTSFTKQPKQILQANDNLFEANTQDNDAQGKASRWKRCPGEGIYKGHIFVPAGLLKDIWKAQFLAFMKLKKMIQLWSPQICLEILSIYIHLKMETEEFFAWFRLIFDADKMLSISSNFKLLSWTR